MLYDKRLLKEITEKSKNLRMSYSHVLFQISSLTT